MTVSPEKIAEMLAGPMPSVALDRDLYAALGLVSAVTAKYLMLDPQNAEMAGDKKLMDGAVDAIYAAVIELTTLRSQLSGITEETSSWQPIETAPKDGQIVVWCPTMFNGGVYLAKWDDDRYAKNPRPYWSLSDEVIFGKTRVRECQPTHWQPPLPPPPGAHP